MPYPTILMEIAYISCRIRKKIGLQVQGMADLGKKLSHQTQKNFRTGPGKSQSAKEVTNGARVNACFAKNLGKNNTANFDSLSENCVVNNNNNNNNNNNANIYTG